MRRLLITTVVLLLLLGPPLLFGAGVIALRWPGTWLEAILYLGGSIGSWIALLASLAKIFDTMQSWRRRRGLPADKLPPRLPFYTGPRFGELLRHYLEIKGWTQTSLHHCLREHEFTVSFSHLNHCISGRAYPRTEIIHGIAQCLGLNQDQEEALRFSLLFDINTAAFVYYMRMGES